MDTICKNCKFWLQERCHRNPPQQVIKGYVYDPKALKIDEMLALVKSKETSIIAAKNYPAYESFVPLYYSGWPFTKEDDFCGEFSRV